MSQVVPLISRSTAAQIIAVGMSVVCLIALIFGVLADLRLVALPLVVLGALIFARSAEIRFSFVTVGGLLVLQSSDGINEAKLIYFLGCAVAFGVGFYRICFIQDSVARSGIRLLIAVSIAWTLTVGISSIAAIWNGHLLTNWLRDAIPYLLLAAIPLAVADLTVSLQRNPRSRFPVMLFVGFGAVSAVTFSATWIDRRGYAELPIAGSLLSSFAVTSAFFCYSCARALAGSRHNLLWGVAAASVFVLVLLTGTRTGLILLLVPLAVILHQYAYASTVIPRAISMVAVAGFAGLLALGAAQSLGFFDLAEIFSRFAALGGILGDSTQGQSFEDRVIQTRITMEAFVRSPIIGIGPGYMYTWHAPYSTSPIFSLVVDSPASIAAKFGIVGAVCFGLTLAALYIISSYLARQNRFPVESCAIFSYLSVTIVLSWMSSPIEDKGFSFALAFLLVLGVQRMAQLRNGAP